MEKWLTYPIFEEEKRSSESTKKSESIAPNRQHFNATFSNIYPYTSTKPLRIQFIVRNNQFSIVRHCEKKHHSRKEKPQLSWEGEIVIAS